MQVWSRYPLELRGDETRIVHRGVGGEEFDVPCHVQPRQRGHVTKRRSSPLPRSAPLLLSTRWITALSSKVTLHHAIKMRVLRSASCVTLPPGTEGGQTPRSQPLCTLPCHVQPLEEGRATKHRSSPLHRSPPPNYLPIRSPAAIKFRVLCGASLVTLTPGIEGRRNSRGPP